MTEEIDAVLFDAGGTLIDMSPPREKIVSEVLAKLDMKVAPPKVARALAKADGVFDAEIAALDGKNEQAFWLKYDDFVLEELGFEGDVTSFSREAEKVFDVIIPNVGSWIDYPDTRPILEMLGGRDLVLGVVSNATDLAKRVLDNLDLTKYFETVVWSEDVGVRKPSPEIFHVAADRIGVSPSRCIYAGDKLSVDVMGAKNAGMNAVLIDRAGAYPHADCLRGKDLNVFKRFL